MWQWCVRKSRPRIWLDESRIAGLRAKLEGKSPEDIRSAAGSGRLGKALVYVIAGDEDVGRDAVASMIASEQRNDWAGLWALGLVYDWCYEVLTAEQERLLRHVLIRESLIRIANGNLWRSFDFRLHQHGAAIGLAAIALYDVDAFGPYALEFLKTHYMDAMKVFDDLFADGEWHEGFDLNRSATGCALRFLWALKTATGDDLMESSPHIRNTSQYIIHCCKPDGLIYPGGDNDYPYLNDRDREMLLMLAAEFRDPYAQYMLNNCTWKTFIPTRLNVWHDLLWYDPTIREKPLEDLPRSRVFRGHGLVVARSGWGWDSEDTRLPVSWVTFRCGRFYGRHGHCDNNHFEIYHRGELAIDSGRNDDEWGIESNEYQMRRSQFFNYYRRSVAHNTILVYDPGETMEMGVANDGGQKELLRANGLPNDPENYSLGTLSPDGDGTPRDWAANPGRWDTGEILAYSGNNLFTYVCGDATKSYAERKVESFVRQLLFIQPDLVVVFDRVAAIDPACRKTWLLHSINKPRLHADGAFEIAYKAGRLVCVPVLPEPRSIDRIGGPGKEFTVAGLHYGEKGRGAAARPLRLGELPGAWRIEMSPAIPSEEDYFLNVILLTHKDSKAVPGVTVEDRGAGQTAIAVELPNQRSVCVSFARGPTPGAQLLVEERGRSLFEGAMPDSVVPEKGRI